MTEVIADNLEIPWSLVFLPDGSMMFTERPGRVRLITADSVLFPEPVLTINDVSAVGEGGLLGIELHPRFLENGFVYFYYTYDVTWAPSGMAYLDGYIYFAGLRGRSLYRVKTDGTPLDTLLKG